MSPYGGLDDQPVALLGLIERRLDATEAHPDRRGPAANQTQRAERENTPNPPNGVPDLRILYL
jgi:hypothetical protein